MKKAVTLPVTARYEHVALWRRTHVMPAVSIWVYSFAADRDPSIMGQGSLPTKMQS